MRVRIDHGNPFWDAAHVVIGTGDVLEHDVTVKDIGCDLHE